MMKTTGKGSPETYFTMTMEGAFITKVSNSGTEEGNVIAEGRAASSRPSRSSTSRRTTTASSLRATKTYNWDIPAGTASPSA